MFYSAVSLSDSGAQAWSSIYMRRAHRHLKEDESDRYRSGGIYPFVYKNEADRCVTWLCRLPYRLWTNPEKNDERDMQTFKRVGFYYALIFKWKLPRNGLYTSFLRSFYFFNCQTRDYIKLRGKCNVPVPFRSPGVWHPKVPKALCGFIFCQFWKYCIA